MFRATNQLHKTSAAAKGRDSEIVPTSTDSWVFHRVSPITLTNEKFKAKYRIETPG